MAAIIAIEGQQPFRVESAASSIVALRMAGFIRSYRADGSEVFSLEGKPTVVISGLNRRPVPAAHTEVCAYDCGEECLW